MNKIGYAIGKVSESVPTIWAIIRVNPDVLTDIVVPGLTCTDIMPESAALIGIMDLSKLEEAAGLDDVYSIGSYQKIDVGGDTGYQVYQPEVENDKAQSD